MPWVKQNYDRFLLALFAVLLLACAGLLFANAHGFATVFEGIRNPARQNTTVPSVQEEAVTENLKQIPTPEQWQARIIDSRRLPVFDSVPYIAKTTVDGSGNQTQTLIDPLDAADGKQLHPPVTNGWLLDNRQDLLSPNVLEQDSDGDGFSTVDEFNGHTDPNDKSSHPPYWSKLVMTQLKLIPFRLRFDAKNGDTIQINIIDIEDAPTWFGKVGGTITLTKPPFKVTKFEQKSAKLNGITKDVSEVTVQNVETGEVIVLPKQQEVNSPTSYAVLSYLWNNTRFAVKKNQEFPIKPEENIKYKALELNETSVTLLKEDENRKIIVKLVPGAK